MKVFLTNLAHWVLKNSWNLFGILGVLGTFYFSLFYVPDYVDQISSGKTNVIHERLVGDVQELFFYDQSVSANEIEALIKGKELSSKTEYPYSPDELLVQVQERFMGNKFIPIIKRKKLFETINEIRVSLPPIESLKIVPYYDYLTYLISLIGVLFGAIGALGLSDKSRRDKEVEADIGIDEDENLVCEPIKTSDKEHSAHGYEKLIHDILLELAVDRVQLTPLNGDSGHDLEVRAGDRDDYYVECKGYKRLVGLRSVSRFINSIFVARKKGILVTATGLTKRSKDAIMQHNNMYPDIELFVVTGTGRKEVKQQLSQILKPSGK